MAFYSEASSYKAVEKDFKIRAHDLTVSKANRGRSKPFLIPASASGLITWNISRVKAPQAWLTTRGKSIKVAVIDTGIANHPDLKIAGGINTIDEGSFVDDNGHGTHVAGIAAAIGRAGKVTGTAPEVELYAVKALDKNGNGFVSDIVEGIDWFIRNRIQGRRAKKLKGYGIRSQGAGLMQLDKIFKA